MPKCEHKNWPLVCQLEAGHEGQHAQTGSRWPVPDNSAELAEALRINQRENLVIEGLCDYVQELINKIAGYEDALKYYADAGEMYDGGHIAQATLGELEL